MNIRLYVKVAAIEVERGGVKVLQVDKIRPKMKLADGHIRLVAADPALQSTGWSSRKAINEILIFARFQRTPSRYTSTTTQAELWKPCSDSSRPTQTTRSSEISSIKS